jgi:hypothetical protein
MIFCPLKTCPLKTRDLYSCIITLGVVRKSAFLSHEAQAACALVPGTLGPKSVWNFTNLYAESALKTGMTTGWDSVAVPEGCVFC